MEAGAVSAAALKEIEDTFFFFVWLNYTHSFHSPSQLMDSDKFIENSVQNGRVQNHGQQYAAIKTLPIIGMTDAKKVKHLY